MTYFRLYKFFRRTGASRLHAARRAIESATRTYK